MTSRGVLRASGPADYRLPGEPDYQRHEDRLRLLSALAQHAPIVLEALRREVAQLDREAWPKAVRDWAAEYNLDSPWFIAIAADTVKLMADPRAYELYCERQRKIRRLARLNGYKRPPDPPLEWAPVRVGELPAELFEDEQHLKPGAEEDVKRALGLGVRWDRHEPLRAVHLHWEALPEWWEAAKKELERRVQQRKAMEGGGAESVTKRRRGSERHFEWFVRWQVLGETQDKITTSASVSVEALRLACKDMANRVGLQRRTVR